LQRVELRYHADELVTANNGIGIEIIRCKQPVEISDRRLGRNAAYTPGHVVLDGLLEEVVHRHSPFETRMRHPMDCSYANRRAGVLTEIKRDKTEASIFPSA